MTEKKKLGRKLKGDKEFSIPIAFRVTEDHYKQLTDGYKEEIKNHPNETYKFSDYMRSLLKTI